MARELQGLTFDVTAVNDAPTATNMTQTLSYTEGDSSVAIDDIVIGPLWLLPMS